MTNKEKAGGVQCPKCKKKMDDLRNAFVSNGMDFRCNHCSEIYTIELSHGNKEGSNNE